jgi:microcystin-dependent protein
MLSSADQAAQQALITAGAVGIAALNATFLSTVTGFKAADTANVAGTTPGTRGLTALSQSTTLDADTVGGLAGVPVGSITIFAGPTTPPTGWLTCDGSAVSRSTYSSLFGQIITSMGTFTVTIAAPGVFTLSAHGMVSGDVIYLTTTGSLPTGLSANTLYWVTVISSSTFNVSTSFANYSAGTKVTTTGTQSGTHTARRCPWGLGDGNTTFTLPDLREAAPVGIGTRGVGVSADTYNLGQFKDDQFQGHWHRKNYYTGITGAAGNAAIDHDTNNSNTALPDARGAVRQPIDDGTNGTPRTGTTTRGKRLGVSFIIKY